MASKKKEAKKPTKPVKAVAKKAVKITKIASKKVVSKKALVKPKPVLKTVKKIVKPLAKKAIKKVNLKIVKPTKSVTKKVEAVKLVKKIVPKKPIMLVETKKPIKLVETKKPIQKPLPVVQIQAKEVQKLKPNVKKPEVKQVKIAMPKITTKTSVKYNPSFIKSVLDNREVVIATNISLARYSDSDLAEFREIIYRKLDAAKKELAYLHGLITRKDESGGDVDDARYMTMEDGSISMEREQLSQMASRQITFIDHLEKAIIRIENKTYGICRVTGTLIDKARLKAVPHATLSIAAKQMINR